jgi:predicted NAD/FAD-dependent oxidoreductase
MNHPTVVIGAGLAGLLLARGLAAAGANVVGVEKSRGFGGRMATKRVGEPKNTHPERCVWLPELGVGFAGDGFGGPKIEGAAMSALALAHVVAQHPQSAS